MSRWMKTEARPRRARPRLARGAFGQCCGHLVAGGAPTWATRGLQANGGRGDAGGEAHWRPISTGATTAIGFVAGALARVPPQIDVYSVEHYGLWGLTC